MIGQRITIKEEETIRALERIGKGKACSKDGLMDLIYKEEEYKKVRINGRAMIQW